MTSFWDARYAEPGYAYGTEPNDFLREVADRLPAGPVLCLGEGEGRNAVWLAERGHAVTALDASEIGLRKTRELAAARGVEVRTVASDVAAFDLGVARWSAIVTVFFHLPPELRRRVHAAIPPALVPGGALVAELFRPDQLALGTGGPRSRELLVTLDDLRRDLAGLDLVIARDVDRPIHEGRYHDGPSAVVQVLGLRP